MKMLLQNISADVHICTHALVHKTFTCPLKGTTLGPPLLPTACSHSHLFFSATQREVRWPGALRTEPRDPEPPSILVGRHGPTLRLSELLNQRPRLEINVVTKALVPYFAKLESTLQPFSELAAR